MVSSDMLYELFTWVSYWIECCLRLPLVVFSLSRNPLY